MQNSDVTTNNGTVAEEVPASDLVSNDDVTSPESIPLCTLSPDKNTSQTITNSENGDNAQDGSIFNKNTSQLITSTENGENPQHGSISSDKEPSSDVVTVGAAPDGGWGWVIVVGATVTHFLLVGLARCLGVVYQCLRERYQSSSADTAWIASIFNTSRTITAPLCSYLCERFGCRQVAVAGGLVFSAGLIISAFATNLLYLFFSFGIVAGFGGVMVFTPAYIMVGRYFDKRKGTAMGLATLGSGVGHIVLAPLINTLLGHYGFFGAMLILGALVMNTCVSGLLYRPLRSEQKPKMEKIVEEGKDTDVENNSGVEIKRSSACNRVCSECDVRIWKNKAFIVYCFLMAGMQYAIAGTLVFLTGYADELGVSDSDAALLLSLYGIVDLISRFIYAFIFDLKFFRSARRFLHAFIGLIFGVSTVVIGFMPTHVTLAVAVGFNALFESGFHSQRATILSELVDKSSMSMAVGLMIAFQGVGNLTGPPIAGLLRDVTGSHSVCFFWGGGVFLFLVILFNAVIYKQKLCRKMDVENRSLSSDKI